ncbi:hypothetical protein SDC9_154223 [bioreactor metagenome]|uniref:Uncharacterized protein n=1 Tax=bioreactor metagenome TaxID=1076179 RepID=A0A645EZU8_9ZZZZ
MIHHRRLIYKLKEYAASLKRSLARNFINLIAVLIVLERNFMLWDGALWLFP